jgi:hypothetical protein
MPLGMVCALTGANPYPPPAPYALKLEGLLEVQKLQPRLYIGKVNHYGKEK